VADASGGDRGSVAWASIADGAFGSLAVASAASGAAARGGWTGTLSTRGTLSATLWTGGVCNHNTNQTVLPKRIPPTRPPLKSIASCLMRATITDPNETGTDPGDEGFAGSFALSMALAAGAAD
jgi:hypothetical protein